MPEDGMEIPAVPYFHSSASSAEEDLSRKTYFSWVLDVDKLKYQKVKGFASGDHLNNRRIKVQKTGLLASWSECSIQETFL